MHEVVRLGLLGVQKDSSVVSIDIVIGAPFEDDGAWFCPMALRDLDPRTPDIGGVDAFQALCLALQLVRARLNDFIAKGGRLYLAHGGPETPGSEFVLDSYFGAAP